MGAVLYLQSLRNPKEGGVFINITSSIASLESCMSSNRLSLNPSKNQLIWLGTRKQLFKLG